MGEDISRFVLYILNWNFFSVVGALIVGAAVSVIGLQQWNLGYSLFAIAGIWAAAHWIESALLREKRALLKTRRLRRDEQLSKQAAINLWGWSASISLLIILGCAACEYWVWVTKGQFERDDVFNHLTIQPNLPLGTDPSFTTFTIMNGSSYSISAKHRVTCKIRFSRSSDEGMIKNVFERQDQDGKFTFSSPDAEEDQPIPVTSEIDHGGDSQTDACLSGLLPPAPYVVLCADVTVRFDYFLSVQPTTLQKKSVRLVYGIYPATDRWVSQPVDSEKDFCANFRQR